MAKSIEPERIESDLDVAHLKKLMREATRGPWRIGHGLMGKDLFITAYEREPTHSTKGDGPICNVRQEQHHYESKSGHRAESRSWETAIKKARPDAELIVAAVNALPELLRRLGYADAETAWLIEWPADDYGPIRYWAAGKPKPVIDVNKATRFARREDAMAVMGAHACETGCKVVEFIWSLTPEVAEADHA